MLLSRAGFWQVSTHGRVCNTRGHISYGSRLGTGSLKVSIEHKQFLVHRLVAFAHLRFPPTPLHDKVLHIDGNVANNHVSNLQYSTAQDLTRYAARPLQGLVHSNACRPVLSRRLGEVAWVEHVSAGGAAEACSVTERVVRLCLSRGLPARAGLEFKYAPRENLFGEEWTNAVHPLTGTILVNTMISSKGRVLNSKGICTWGSLTKAGYCNVGIQGTRHFVHRLVLCSFTQSMPTYPWVVNHIDGNKLNNILENLEFTTQAQNVKHSIRNSVYKPAAPSMAVFGRPQGSKEWIRFESQTAAAVHLGCTPGSICYGCKGHGRSVKGWHFQSALDQSTLPGEQWSPVALELPAA
mmetsp:Transcript_46865/g.85897  ORF Transcript_46865/g.85897 Transcript_46865/m.85897 type:complete len:352 (+) Transcript_46865:66-1121(+)